MQTTTTTLCGKVCLVTGASLGLGAAIARTLAAQGATVAVHYHRSAAQAQALCAELAAAGATAVPVQADLLDPGAIEPLVAAVTDQLGPVDVLVNNFGPYVDTPFLDLTLIAAHARSLQATLITHNTREFGRVDGLRVEDWASAVGNA